MSGGGRAGDTDRPGTLRLTLPFAMGRSLVGAPFALLLGGALLLANSWSISVLVPPLVAGLAVGASAAAATVLEGRGMACGRRRYPWSLAVEICAASAGLHLAAFAHLVFVAELLRTGAIATGVSSALSDLGTTSPRGALGFVLVLLTWSLTFAVASAMRMGASLAQLSALLLLQVLGVLVALPLVGLLYWLAMVTYGAVAVPLLLGGQWVADKLTAQACGWSRPSL